MKEEDVILLKVALRFGPGEIDKIIDDACARKGRNPLEEYYLCIEQFNRITESEKSRKEAERKNKLTKSKKST